MRTVLVWLGVLTVMAAPVVAAAFSPLLAWRQPVYIVAGFAGVIALSTLVIQPLLAVKAIPGLSARQASRLHQWLGVALVLGVLLHVLGLWITSPPDVIDALLFVSPTPFSHWGVIAFWGVLLTACVMVARKRFRLKPPVVKRVHRLLMLIIVPCSVAHTWLIDGTMETITKTMVCIAVLLTSAWSLSIVLKKQA